MTYVNRPANLQERLDAVVAYARDLRREHKGNDQIGEICDQIELRAHGPVVVRDEHGEFKGFQL